MKTWLCVAVLIISLPFLLIFLITQPPEHHTVVVKTTQIPNPRDVFDEFKRIIKHNDAAGFHALLSDEVALQYSAQEIQGMYQLLYWQLYSTVDAAVFEGLDPLSDKNDKPACCLRFSYTQPFSNERRHESVLLLLENHAWKICYPCDMYQYTGVAVVSSN